MQSYFNAADEYFAYFDQDSASSIIKALEDLDSYIASADKPFDAVMGFSQGAGLAAMYMIRDKVQKQSDTNTAKGPTTSIPVVTASNVDPNDRQPKTESDTSSIPLDSGASTHRPFKCAVFLSSPLPWDFSQEKVVFLQHDPQSGGPVIRGVPTAHIYDAKNDHISGDMCEQWAQCCDANVREVYVHQEGHDVPKGKDSVIGAVKVLRRVLDM